MTTAREVVERLRKYATSGFLVPSMAPACAKAADLIESQEANLDAGREWMRRAWHELNAIRARDGAPEGVSEEWWSELTDALGAMLGDDTKPWMLTAAERLVAPYKAECAALQVALDEAVRERERQAEIHEINTRSIIKRSDYWQAHCLAAESRLRAYESGDAGELVKELDEDAEYIESYDGFIGSQLRIAGNQRKAAHALREADARERKLREALFKIAFDDRVSNVQSNPSVNPFHIAYHALGGRMEEGVILDDEASIRARTATGGEG